MVFPSCALSVLSMLLGTHILQARANTFLGLDRFAAARANRSRHDNLLSELERVVGSDRRGVVEVRAELLKETMLPIFRALPHGPGNRLPADAVRYLLHRLFVDRHGWYVLGLDSRGEAWNSSSPTEVFKSHDSEVQSVFEKHLSLHGFSLDEVAVLAATLESFVHVEMTERLSTSFGLVDLSNTTTSTSEAKILEAMDAYMLMYLLELNYTDTDRLLLSENMRIASDIYPAWEETRKWVREVRMEALAKLKPSESPTSFGTTSRVVVEVEDRYGRWQAKECQDIKNSLVKMEDGDSGRVRLDTFYGSALQGNWQFSESKAYLQQLGALDETEPFRPSVIIANYVNSPSNCVAGSKFYSVCCIDECEALLGNLEQQISAPTALPARIVEVVSSMPSATVQAPRSLPASLVGRLQEIASQHGGKVPLHSRLFMQWLHNAYPRECVYPQVSGTSKPAKAMEWMEQTGEDAAADEEAMRWQIEEAGLAENVSAMELPWSVEEELFVAQLKPLEPWLGRKNLRMGAVLTAVAASMGLTMARTASSAVSAAAGQFTKYSV